MFVCPRVFRHAANDLMLLANRLSGDIVKDGIYMEEQGRFYDRMRQINKRGP